RSDVFRSFSSHFAARPRIWSRAVTLGCSGAGAAGRPGTWTALHLSQRKYSAPIRVPAERLDSEHQVLRLDRRERPAARKSGAGTALPGCRRFQQTGRWRFTTSCFWTSAVHNGPRRRVFLSARLTRLTLFRRGWKYVAVRRSPLKGRHQTHAKLKSILTFAFSAPLVRGLGHNRPRIDRITIEPGKCVGRPCIRGYRVPKRRNKET